MYEEFLMIQKNFEIVCEVKGTNMFDTAYMISITVNIFVLNIHRKRNGGKFTKLNCDCL